MCVHPVPPRYYCVHDTNFWVCFLLVSYVKLCYVDIWIFSLNLLHLFYSHLKIPKRSCFDNTFTSLDFISLDYKNSNVCQHRRHSSEHALTFGDALQNGGFASFRSGGKS